MLQHAVLFYNVLEAHKRGQGENTASVKDGVIEKQQKRHWQFKMHKKTGSADKKKLQLYQHGKKTPASKFCPLNKEKYVMVDKEEQCCNARLCCAGPGQHATHAVLENSHDIAWRGRSLAVHGHCGLKPYAPMFPELDRRAQTGKNVFKKKKLVEQENKQ